MPGSDVAPAYGCRLVDGHFEARPSGVSLFETAVLNTLTEGFALARVNLSHCVLQFGNSILKTAGAVRFSQSSGRAGSDTALPERHISPRVGSVVEGERTQQDVVLELLKDLHDPARYTAYGKNWHEQIALDAKQVVDNA